MSDTALRPAWRPDRTKLVAGGLVVAGFALCGVSWWFFLLVGLGTFGPGVLRELGLLRDKDEFEVRAAHRAGYHAFLTAGVTAVALVAFFRSGVRDTTDLQELATLFLSLLWLSWFFSSLLGYWGAPKTAARVLRGFGAAWLAFLVLSNTGSEWTGWAALLLQPLLALPFFALAWTAGRWPRITGATLLVASASFVGFFGMFQNPNMALVNEAVTFLLFVGPLLASGLALVGHRSEPTD